MTNYKQPGMSIEYTAGSAISSGDVIALADRIGIALTDIANGSKGTVNLEGVYSLAAETDAAFSQGDQLFWDTSASELTKTPNANTVPAGLAHEAKASSTATALVRLQPNMKRSAAVADLSQDISATYVEAEVQAISDKVDELLAALRAAGLMKS